MFKCEKCEHWRECLADNTLEREGCEKFALHRFAVCGNCKHRVCGMPRPDIEDYFCKMICMKQVREMDPQNLEDCSKACEHWEFCGGLDESEKID